MQTLTTALAAALALTGCDALLVGSPLAAAPQRHLRTAQFAVAMQVCAPRHPGAARFRTAS